MSNTVTIVGAGLAGSEAALNLASRGISVRLVEMRPAHPTAVHHTGDAAELVCSNSLKSTKPDSAAGLLKAELATLGSPLIAAAKRHAVAAGGALAVDRVLFSRDVTRQVEEHPLIAVERREATDIPSLAAGSDAIVLASGPLTSDALSSSLMALTGRDALAFYDAAAPVVMADSIDFGKVFRQSRYEDAGAGGDYLNAPFTREEYDAFIEQLLAAERVIAKDFETRELFQACQPIEEIARAGRDAPRFGTLKPVGLTDPRTGRRPWAALQLRAEDAHGASYNLVGFQTNLTFPEQRRVFRMIPGLEEAEFARYGVMHRNTYLDSPRLLDRYYRLKSQSRIAFAGQMTGVEGYVESCASGFLVGVETARRLKGQAPIDFPQETAIGALGLYVSNQTVGVFQPMNINFGIISPLDHRVKGKRNKNAELSQRSLAIIEARKEEILS